MVWWSGALFLAIAVTAAVPASNTGYSSEEENCFSQRQVYFRGQCVSLLEKKPCRQGEWLVLDRESPLVRPVCAPTPCNSSDYVYWAEEDRCIAQVGATVCNRRDTSLQADSFGLGACKCMSGEVRAMASNGACYDIYSTGPCGEGRHVRLGAEGEAVCAPDPCFDSPGSLPYLGQCYPRGERGPCHQDKVLRVDVYTGLPACLDDISIQHVIDFPPLCEHTDHNGDCRDKVTVSNVQNNFLLNLTNDRRRRKRQGVSRA